VTRGGKIVNDDNIQEELEIQLAFRLLGGKHQHSIARTPILNPLNHLINRQRRFWLDA
jgi:hypothetical protein